VNGFIQKIYVDEGQTVRKGQIPLEPEMLNQDASFKAMVQAAEVEVNRQVLWTEIYSDVMLKRLKPN
jgi:multidrug efflux pump subunit AcrA (membrane-fusion protein)